MGVDRHEAARRGKRTKTRAKPSSKVRDMLRKHAPDEAATALAATTVAVDPAEERRAKGRAFLSGGDAPPAVVQDSALPSALPGTVFAPPAARGRETRAEKMDRTQTVDVRIPRAWLEELAHLTGEHDAPATGKIRAGIVLLRALHRKP